LVSKILEKKDNVICVVNGLIRNQPVKGSAMNVNDQEESMSIIKVKPRTKHSEEMLFFKEMAEALQSVYDDPSRGLTLDEEDVLIMAKNWKW